MPDIALSGEGIQCIDMHLLHRQENSHFSKADLAKALLPRLVLTCFLLSAYFACT